jgi:hypothetical protein
VGPVPRAHLARFWEAVDALAALYSVPLTAQQRELMELFR